MKRKDTIFIPSRAQFEDHYSLAHIEKLLKHKRGWIFKMPKEGEAVILLVSGGLDSISIWNLLLHKYKLHVYPIHFLNPIKRRGNRELRSIRTFSKIFKERYPKLFHEVFIKEYKFSFAYSHLKNRNTALFDLSDLMNNLFYDPEHDMHSPALINTPSRLGIYSFGAYEYAYLLKLSKSIYVNTIFCSIVPEDGRNLRESTLTVLRSITLSLCLILGNFNWQFSAPIEKREFYYTKGALAKFSLADNLPLEKTWSCGKHFSIHCGKCVNCTMRKQTFQQLHFTDKTAYRQKPSLPLRLKKRRIYLQRKLLTLFNKNSARKIALQSSMIIVPSPKITWKEKNGTISLLNTESHLFEELNSSGSLIFKEIIKGKATVSSIICTLRNTYEIDESQVKKDALFFLEQHIQKGYLRIKGDRIGAFLGHIQSILTP